MYFLGRRCTCAMSANIESESTEKDYRVGPLAHNAPSVQLVVPVWSRMEFFARNVLYQLVCLSNTCFFHYGD